MPSPPSASPRRFSLAARRRSGLQKVPIRDWEDLSTSAAVERGIDAFTEAYATDEPARMAGARLAALRAGRCTAERLMPLKFSWASADRLAFELPAGAVLTYGHRQRLRHALIAGRMVIICLITTIGQLAKFAGKSTAM